MQRANEIYLYAKFSLALANTKGIPFLAVGNDTVALRITARDCSRTSLQPVYFPQVLTL